MKEQLKSEAQEESLDFHSTYYPSTDTNGICTVNFTGTGALVINGSTITFPAQVITSAYVGNRVYVGETNVAVSADTASSASLKFNQWLTVSYVAGVPVVQLPILAVGTQSGIIIATGASTPITTATAAQANAALNGYISVAEDDEYLIAQREIVGERTKRAFRLNTMNSPLGPNMVCQPGHRCELFSM